jgi:RimJ/RimL family protein N-acetyltransferase
MKLNYETCIVGNRCVLVPYRPQHVEKYHVWMQDAHLLEATGSEPLTLQQEYEMQESWRLDEAKCTFIILARDLLATTIPNDRNHDTDNDDDTAAASFIINNLQAMVGDVNLFLSTQEEEDNDDNEARKEKDENQIKSNDQKATSLPHMQAELDIMIAEPSCRKLGIGREAVCLMMLYGIRHLNISRFYCKINQNNTASRSLFGRGVGDNNNCTNKTSSSSSLGFVQCGYAECFGQYEYELKCEHVNELDQVVTALLGTTELHTFSCPIETTTRTTMTEKFSTDP